MGGHGASTEAEPEAGGVCKGATGVLVALEVGTVG